MYDIRLLNLGEEQQFIQLKQRSLRENQDVLLESSYNPPLAYVTAQINAGPKSDVNNVVLVVDNELVGFCQIILGHDKRRHKAIMRNIFVIQNEKTKGMKFGIKIVEFIHDYLKTLKYEEISAGIIPGHRSEKILESLGYHTTSTELRCLKLADNSYVDIRNWTKSI
jgi:hypothetical protein